MQAPVRQPRGPADDDRVPVDDADDTASAVIGETLDGGQLADGLASLGRDRLGNRVLGGVLDRPGEPQQLAGLVPGVVTTSVTDMRPVVTVPVLSRTIVSMLSGRLQDLRPANDDPELSAASGADEQSGWRGKPERAGAGDDQDGDSSGERLGRRPGGEVPADPRRGGDGHDDGDEDRRHPVSQPLDGCLARLGGRDQCCHLCQLGVGTDAGGPHDETTTDVDGRADHAVVDCPPRPGTLSPVSIDVSTADEPSITTPSVAIRSPGRTTNTSPTVELLDRDARLDAVPENGDILGAEAQQCTEGRAGPLLGAALEVAAGDDEGRSRRMRPRDRSPRYRMR